MNQNLHPAGTSQGPQTAQTRGGEGDPVRANIADILCIGCQKGSTSWLHSVLACHPRTWSFPSSEPLTSTDKEAHFWDWNRQRGVDWYRQLLLPPEPGLLSMDFTPEYAYLGRSQIEECQRLSPKAKVVYVLRDPLARALSALRMHLLWKHGKDWKGRMQLDTAFYELVNFARLDLHGDYTGHVRRWRVAYPDMLVVNYEDFHRDRAASVERVMHWIGLDPGELDTESRARLDGLMDMRVWQSEPYAIDRPALLFLEGLVRRWRDDCARELEISFTEGPELLGDTR